MIISNEKNKIVISSVDFIASSRVRKSIFTSEKVSFDNIIKIISDNKIYRLNWCFLVLLI